MPSEHAKISPSAIDGWITCSMYPRVQKQETELHPWTVRGTAIHWIGEQCLLNGRDARIYVDVKDPDGTVITAEMADCAQVYIDYCRMSAKEYPGALVKVENRVSLEHWGFPHVFGTADFIIDDTFNALIDVDLKSGKGVSVPADSLQLRLYLVMAAGDLLETYEKLTCVIVQPNDKYGDTIKQKNYTSEELIKWMEEIVIPAIHKCESDSPTYQPSEKACRWCSINGTCPGQAKEALQVTLSAIQSAEGDISNDSIAQILKHAEFIRDWLRNVELQATNKLISNEEIPGFKLVQAQTKSRWDDTVDVGKILKKDLKLKDKDIYEKRLKSIKKIKAVTPKLKQPLLEKLITKPEGHLVIAPDTDFRPSTDAMISFDVAFKDF